MASESKGSGMSTYLLSMATKISKYNEEHAANERAHPTIIATRRGRK